jgi:hypothetical protein
MSDSTIPDAVAADLRDLYLAAPPAGIILPAERVRLKHSTDALPSPRLVILTGDPQPVPRMDGTAKIPVSIEYITAMDSVTPAAHQLAAGALDAWWRSIRASKRRNVIVSRVYLHDLTTTQPSISIRAEDREQVTAIRGQLTVTLVSI